jgi:catechol 2,3-dioxygenase-like lactoylglutathione lyase family enzyme
MLRSIDRILIRVPQVAGAVKYYREVLGLLVVREDVNRATLRFPDGAGEIVLHSDPNLPAEGIYFLVDDLRDMYQRRDELKLTFLSAPAQASRGWTAAVKDPFGVVLQLLDRTAAQQSTVEDAAPVGGLFGDVEPKHRVNAAALVELYEKIGRTADDLPYTPHFEELYEPYAASYPEPKPTRAEVWRHLLNLRKSKKLPRLGDARSHVPDLPEHARTRLRQIVSDDIGRRDRLPYTDRFDQLVDAFNKTLDKPLSPHLIWRAIATLAK